MPPLAVAAELEVRLNTTERGQPANAFARWFASTFASLQHRSFRFYCLGVIISLTGSLLQEVVVAWLAYQKTGSSFALGAVLFAFQVPMLVFGLLGGIARS